MKNKTTALAALLVVASAFIPAHADAPEAPLAAESPKIEFGSGTEMNVVDLLKLVAKTYKVDIVINGDVGGKLLVYKISFPDAKQALALIARAAKLTVTEKDGIFTVSKAVGGLELIRPQPAPIPPQQTLRADGFRLKLSLHSQQLYAGDSLESELVLERRPGQPDAAIMWGSTQNQTLIPSIIALKDNSWIPFSERLSLDLGRFSANPLQNLYSAPSVVAEGKPLSLSFDPVLRLEKPLEPGKYLYFVTYKSFSRGKQLGGQEIFDGELVSNMVEFEVLATPPSPGRIYLLDK